MNLRLTLKVKRWIGLDYFDSIVGSKIMVITIDVAPITQVTHVRNINNNIQGRSLNVIKVIFYTIRNYS